MNAINKIKDIIKKEQDEAYKNGVLEGLRSAERIYLWYSTNDNLRTPYSETTLKKWALAEISRLRGLFCE